MNKIIQGDCVEELKKLPDNSVDLIFADPPYNLQLKSELIRPNQTKVDAVDDSWDKFNSFNDYDDFSISWLKECRRVLKDNGTIWVIGSYHNIFRVGKIMMDLGFWVLNDVIWYKTNPMPNFKGTRFTNATETLLWCKKSEHQKKYTFNYKAMKQLNNGKQMQSVWQISLCIGNERIKGDDGKKAHSTQKPEELLRRVILSSSNEGDTILDPFFGSGTTGAVAKKLNRNFIGIEKEQKYIEVATKRIDEIKPDLFSHLRVKEPERNDLPKVPFPTLLKEGYIKAGSAVLSRNKKIQGLVMENGNIKVEGREGSIHQMGAYVQGKEACNGWTYWYLDSNGEVLLLDIVRNRYRVEKELMNG